MAGGSFPVTSLVRSRVAPGWHGPGCTVPVRLSAAGSARPPAPVCCQQGAGSSHPWVTCPQFTRVTASPWPQEGHRLGRRWLQGPEAVSCDIGGRSYPPVGSRLHPTGSGSRCCGCSFLHPRETLGEQLDWLCKATSRLGLSPALGVLSPPYVGEGCVRAHDSDKLVLCSPVCQGGPGMGGSTWDSSKNVLQGDGGRQEEGPQ